MNIFNEGKEQNIAQVLNAKDKRVALQQKIFAKYPDQTLVDVNLNITGPIKNNRFLEKLFNYGIKQFEASWDKLGFAYKLVVSLYEDTGCENFYILDLSITPLFLDEIWDKVRANVLSVIDQLKNVLALGGILLQKCKIIFLNYMQRM